MTTLIRESKYDLFVRLLLYLIVLGNITTLFIVFSYPRMVFMVRHWGASEREILLSEGPLDSPNTEHLRRIYRLMYFIKDNTGEDSVISFVTICSSKAEAYKILLPRKVRFIDSEDKKRFSLLNQRTGEIPHYFVFKKEDRPVFYRENKVVWDESGWGIYRVR